MKINMYEKQDEEKLKQLLDICSAEEYLVHIINSSKLKCAFTAIDEGKVVGIIVAWTSDFHPYCTYFRMIIHPSFDQMNIDRKLLAKMEACQIEKRPLQTSIWETDTSLRAFYESCGFFEIRKTYLPVLKNELEKWNDNPRHVTSLSTISADHHLMKNLTKLVKRIYEQTHIDNPVAEFSLEDWKKMILADDVIMDGSFVYLDSTRTKINAYSFLHVSEKADRLELGWCGSQDDQNLELIPQLVRSQIIYAKKHGYTFIEGEFDTTSKYAMEVFRTIPFPPCETWITYQKE